MKCFPHGLALGMPSACFRSTQPVLKGFGNVFFINIRCLDRPGLLVEADLTDYGAGWKVAPKSLFLTLTFKKVKLKYCNIDFFFPATTTTKTIDIFQTYRVRRYDLIPRSLGELNLQPFSIWLKFTFFSMFVQPVRATGAA